MSEEFLKVQCETDGEPFEVAYSILSPEEFLPAAGDPRRAEIMRGLENAEAKTDALGHRIAEINQELEKYTNTADKLDYTVAVASGVITGMIDVLVVGKWDFEKAKAASNQDVNNKVVAFAKKDPQYVPWCSSTAHGRRMRDPNRLESAIEFLEHKYHLPGDGEYSKGDTSIGARSHRLDDFCHHPTLVGLICCVIVQFTGSTIYSNSDNELIQLPVQVNKYGKFVGDSPIAKVFAGVVNWCLNVAGAITNQKGHLMSDMSTSAGIPGPLMSMLKEVSALFGNKDFSEQLRRAYQNGIGSGKKQIDLGTFNELFGGASSKLDGRTEAAVAHELKRQAIPVIINEVLVRGFYFVRRLVMQYKENNGWDGIDWRKVVPFNNRTIVRMMTIASGTFTAIDMAGAAIQGAAKSGGNAALFAKEFLLNVNFVGVGRFVIAVGADVAMGIKAGKLRNERLQLSLEMMHWTNTKVFYTQANMWISAENAQKALIAAYQSMEVAYVAFANYLIQAQRTLDSVDIAGMEQYNPGLVAELLDCLHE